jgi:hypothetical protein
VVAGALTNIHVKKYAYDVSMNWVSDGEDAVPDFFVVALGARRDAILNAVEELADIGG